MGTRRTRAYWPTRFMPVFGFVSLPAVLLWFNSMQQGTMGPMFTANGVAVAVGAGLWFAGVIWMVRIFRGPSDVPPTWRYATLRGFEAPVRRQ